MRICAWGHDSDRVPFYHASLLAETLVKPITAVTVTQGLLHNKPQVLAILNVQKIGSNNARERRRGRARDRETESFGDQI